LKLEGTYAFEASLDTVWQGLFDPEVLARTLPGCDKLERQGDQFIGEINVKMGPVQGKFQGKVDIQDVKERESYTMIVDGRGAAGFAKATAHIRVSADGAGTRLDYDSDVQVGGRIASVGQRLIDASSRAIVKQSLEGLHAQLKVLAARSGAAEPAAVPAPFMPPGAGLQPTELQPTELHANELHATDGSTVPETGDADGADAIESAADATTRERSEARRAITEPPKAPRSAPTSSSRRPRPLPAPSPPGSSAEPTPHPAPPAPRAPSQAAFALGVAKEVTKELLPTRTLVIVLTLVITAFILYLVKLR
jgi:hypothetical protein